MVIRKVMDNMCQFQATNNIRELGKRVFRMVMVFICMEILVTRVLSEKDFLMVRDFCA